MLAVKRWTRFGKDRLYVSTKDGQRVGWLDLLTGEAMVEMPEYIDAFHEAVRAHQDGQVNARQGGALPAVQEAVEAPMTHDVQGSLTSPSGPSPTTAVSPTHPLLVQEPDWYDLALNRPGQGVRAEAESQRADMKANSRLKTFVARALDVKTDERAFRVGADGEEAVGARLDRLTKHGGRVLHSIPVGKGKSDIDHLVITKGGVYPVNTKRHPGGTVWVGERAILVNGQRTDYLRNSRYEADRVRKALLTHLGVEVPVRAVLVFLTGTVVPQVTIKQMPEDVLVMDRMDIPGAFKRAPVRLSPEMVENVYEVARRSTTWR